ncbi:MAG TPA: SGNH/GDSL hydrolase family protein [Candidatus Gemmiger avistercoris]|uniref:SGNH/GDSL hydrolase family protein n=1 Tax=Candidatus Gemmiger avistercoris TaxID=2838606 RepID=A0A9D2FLL3_9FIRM|nr:SGNH/GDSL hydrolase family protein [uncultured Subdoligranulum sp.]HIZ62741.1 SGNH/GDSL hydrolase family protein [Candidatus Gemmiger avistercoris]
MSDFYTYRNEFSRKRRQRRIVGVLSVLFALACLGAAWYWYQSREPEQTPAPTPTPAAAEPTQSPETAATPAPTPATGETPERIVQAVDTAVWNTSTPVEQTIDTEYFNTDHRMVGVPMLGTVTDSYFNTVTFVGDSIASGLGLYATGLPNAKYATYISAGVNSFVNNATMTNAVTHVEETPMEAIAATQPDYVYLLVGTNNLVTQGNEDSFIAYYERLIDMLRERLNPGVIFYIQAIPGVQETVVESKPGLDNARIATVNDLLANLALRKGCYFVNIREALTNPADGSQIDDYQVTDGVHFNPAGYRAWAEYLATHTVWNRRSIYSGQNPYYIYGA